NDQGTVKEQVAVSTAPIITKQPTNSNLLDPGATKTFSINASNASSYQWQVNTSGAYNDFTDITDGAPYSGATTTDLTITGVTPSMNGYQYRVIATGLEGKKATSNSATLNVKALPTITSQPS